MDTLANYSGSLETEYDNARQYVAFQQVYDLVFRARNARLSSVAYVLDFYDWLRAGIAYNTRGFENPTRKIAYFAKIYGILMDAREQGATLEPHKNLFSQALSYYYADILDIYQDHVKAKHALAALRNSKAKAKSKVVPEFGNLLVLPSFDLVPELRGDEGVPPLFPTRKFPWNGYQCKNVNRFRSIVTSAYVNSETNPGLFSCMSLLYDYGVCHVERGVLLEVTLWNEKD